MMANEPQKWQSREKVFILPIALGSWIFLFFLCDFYRHGVSILLFPSVAYYDETSSLLIRTILLIINVATAFCISYFMSRILFSQNLHGSYVQMIVIISCVMAGLITYFSQYEFMYSILAVTAMSSVAYAAAFISYVRPSKAKYTEVSRNQEQISAQTVVQHNNRTRRFSATLVNFLLAFIVFIFSGVGVALIVKLINGDPRQHTATIGITNIFISSAITYFLLIRPITVKGTNFGKKLFNIYIVSDGQIRPRADQVILFNVFSFVSLLICVSFFPFSYKNGHFLYEKVAGLSVLIKK